MSSSEGENAKEVNTLQASRVKKILSELHSLGVTQKRLAEEIGTKPPTISEWKAGRQTMRRGTAEVFAEAAQKHGVACQADWLTGDSPFRDSDALRMYNYEETRDEFRLLNDGLISFAKFNGFEVRSCFLTSNKPINNNFVFIDGPAVISKNGKYVELSPQDFGDLQEEIAEYVGMRLNRILEKERW